MTFKVLTRGSGDVASAVAHTLFTAGHAVVIHDSARPSATRRKMAFCDAIFDGFASLSGVSARLYGEMPDLIAGALARDCVAVTTLELAQILPVLRPDVLVDARMRKHDRPETQIALAPFTVGLGPNFIAGETVHAAVETGWNTDLGKVIWRGATRPLEGEPQTIAGHARDRYVYAPSAGIFRTNLQIGDMVSEGQKIATVDGIALHAPISGILRGLTHDDVPVAKKTKVIEVDPRGTAANVTGIAERPRRIALGVLEAVKAWESNSEKGRPSEN
jgi:xanthine dehydrogenase accessory factor